MAEEKKPVFGIEKIFIKDCSLEIPHAPEVFLTREEPKMDLQIVTTNAPLNQDNYEVSIRATISATQESDNKTVFVVEATQTGIFFIQNMPEDDLEIILNVAGPNILFPYLRQTISLLTSNGGFPALNLAPYNFEAAYREQKAEEQSAELQ